MLPIPQAQEAAIFLQVLVGTGSIFTLAAGLEGSRSFIEFDGIMANSDVYINGYHLTTYVKLYIRLCSDDGFDCISAYARVTFDHCWVYDINGGGDRNGFKVGGWGSMTPPSTVPSHIVTYCLAANCKNNGFYANHQCGKAAELTHNIKYNCRADYNMLERVSTTDATDIPGTREVLHYNIAYAGTLTSNMNLPAANVTDNSWTKPGVMVSAADFQSTDSGQITRPRNADGSLPAIIFMRLVNGSDLAGLGY